MTASITTDVICDGCGTFADVLVMADGQRIKLVRERAARHGWTRTGTGPSSQDWCPTCQEPR